MKITKCPHCGKDIFTAPAQDTFKSKNGSTFLLKYRGYYDAGLESGWFLEPYENPHIEAYHAHIWKIGYDDGVAARADARK